MKENNSMYKNEMYKLQEGFNNETNGANSIYDLISIKMNRQISWITCIVLEASEAIDSLDWKHWKAGNTDILNFRVELVDLWHFLMSVEIYIRSHMKALPEIEVTICELHYSSNTFEKTAQTSMMKLIKHALTITDLVGDIDPYVTSVNVYPISKDYAGALKVLNKMYNILFTLECVFYNGSMNTIRDAYLVKNCLNVFRQNHGYADGTYIKIWDNQEDNEHAFDALCQAPNLSYDELYIKLEEIYKEVVEQQAQNESKNITEALENMNLNLKAVVVHDVNSIEPAPQEDVEPDIPAEEEDVYVEHYDHQEPFSISLLIDRVMTDEGELVMLTADQVARTYAELFENPRDVLYGKNGKGLLSEPTSTVDMMKITDLKLDVQNKKFVCLGLIHPSKKMMDLFSVDSEKTFTWYPIGEIVADALIIKTWDLFEVESEESILEGTVNKAE